MSSRRKPVVVGLGLLALVAVVAAGVIALRPPSQSTPTASSGPTAQRVTIRWFFGLGGTTDARHAAEQAFVAKYNATNKDGVTLQLVNGQGQYPRPNDPSYDAIDALKTMIAAGDSPDIVGPMGVGDRSGFQGLFLDLRPQAAARGVDLSIYEPALLQALQDESSIDPSNRDITQIGIPYTVDPGFIPYDKELLKNAGLAPLPTEVGAPYMGKTWDWNELAAIAAKLTLDTNGRNATDPDFDAKHIRQFGFDFPGTDARVLASTFGAGSFIDAKRMTAEVPPAWADAFSWYYHAMWASHIAPTAKESGPVAMALSSDGEAPAGWGMAVLPSWNGKTTSPVGVSTFAILMPTKHREEAFTAMLAIEADPALRAAYGGMPANPALQADSPVLQAMQHRAAYPNAEGGIPSGLHAIADYTAWLDALRSTPNLDIKAELESLRVRLQMDFSNSVSILNQ